MIDDWNIKTSLLFHVLEIYPTQNNKLLYKCTILKANIVHDSPADTLSCAIPVNDLFERLDSVKLLAVIISRLVTSY